MRFDVKAALQEVLEEVMGQAEAKYKECSGKRCRLLPVLLALFGNKV
ncbi:hypothetical protein C8N40_10637 [Pontibacter mucosus]|uniref:Uncharacterized protein n=1 Tax=Pontibacter mucosus TaxID=1649266 RepID=A0A2T5YG15_9BACT|nr:hypothetical protein C8N40_10637 [Pontibacter mucosus]